MKTLTARELVELLRTKHWKDIFISECKNGGSMHGHLRLDGWAMKKSWANPLTVGYEVKISRSDFLGDSKWMSYLQYCNEFYFVCPSGLIQPDELPKEAGLLWASKTGTRLYTKKKAAYRIDGVELEDLYKYILLWRATVHSQGNVYCNETANADYWRSWLEDKDENKKLGYRVSRKIRKLVEERIDKVHCENLALKSQNDKLAYVRGELLKLGFDEIPSSWLFDRRIEEVKKVIPPKLKSHLVRLSSDLELVLKTIEGAKETV